MAKGKYQEWLTSEGMLKLESWARDGLTDEQIAEKIKITRETLSQWKKKYPIISDTLKKGKEVVDIQVENALLKRCLGYKHTEVTREPDETGKLVVTKAVTKEVHPDVMAIAIWLNNRRPDRWRRNHNKEKLDEDRLQRDKDIDGKKYW